MPRMTQAEYLAFQARQMQDISTLGKEPVGEDDESRLHDQIYSFLRGAGVHAIIHSRMDRATTNAVGTADFLFVWGRNAYAVEAKSKTGKLSPEQQGFLVAAKMDGWVTGVVRSLYDLKKLMEL